MNSELAPSVRIRRLAQADLPDVLKIVENAEGAAHWPRGTFVEMLSGEFLSRRIALVATVAGASEVIGFAVASLILPEAELENIAVARAHQRRRIGHCLLSELAGELAKAGVETLHLEVRVSNEAAIGLYRLFGFIERGRRTRYYSDPVEDAVLMTLRLG